MNSQLHAPSALPPGIETSTLLDWSRDPNPVYLSFNSVFEYILNYSIQLNCFL
jgi:hypothetical protein